MPTIRNLFKEPSKYPWSSKELISPEIILEINKSSKLSEIHEFYFGSNLDIRCLDAIGPILDNPRNHNVRMIKLEGAFLNGKTML